ncbi:MAG: glycosyltransferase family 4 protein [Myxococcota bacterium]|nr:glycosyltransferase family 4 protein [Myxococcota bacterium]
MNEAPTLIWLHENFVSARQGGNSRASLTLAALLEAGWKVELICTTRSYLGASYGDGAAQIEQEGNLRVHRLVASGHTSRPRQYLHFCRSALRYASSLPTPDLVFTSSPSLPQVAPALWLSAWNRLPLVLEVRDLWPAFLEQGLLLQSKPLLAALRGLESLAYRSADQVISVSPAFTPYLESMGVASGCLTIAPTGADPSLLELEQPARSLEKQEMGRRQSLKVLYAGSFNTSYGLEVLEAAIDRSADQGIQWLLAGAGDRRADIKACASRNPHVDFLGLLPKNELRPILKTVDVGISIHAPWPLLETTVSGKLFDYLAAGLPVINLAPGQMAEILQISRGGWQVERDPDHLLTQIARVAQISPSERAAIGLRGQTWLREHMHGAASARRVAAAVDRARRNPKRHGLIGLTTRAIAASFQILSNRSRRKLHEFYGDDVRAETIRNALAGFLEKPASQPERPLTVPRLLSD